MPKSSADLKKFEYDSYLISNIEMAYQMGLLQGPNLSEVQRAALTIYLIQEQKRNEKEKIQNFEMQMLVNDKEMYQKYMERKKLEEGEEEQPQVFVDEKSDTVWAAPQNMQDFQKSLDFLEHINKQAKKDHPEIFRDSPENQDDVDEPMSIIPQLQSFMDLIPDEED